MKRTVILFALGLAGLAAWIMLYSKGEGGMSQFGGADPLPPLSWWLIAGLGYATMLVGALLGVACRLIIEQRAKGKTTVDPLKLMRSTLRHADLWLSMLASPLLYGTILQTGADLPTGAFLFFALQSGFSSYVIVNSLLGTKPDGTTEKV
jgi:hypothetical protein